MDDIDPERRFVNLLGEFGPLWGVRPSASLLPTCLCSHMFRRVFSYLGPLGGIFGATKTFFSHFRVYHVMPYHMAHIYLELFYVFREKNSIYSWKAKK